MTNADDITLLVFAKAPIAGRVKTRLQPKCTPAQSAAIAEILLFACIENVAQSWPGPIKLMVWPTLDHPSIERVANRFGIPSFMQSTGDLGHKMYTAMQQFGYPCAVLGSDIPHVSADSLATTCKALRRGRNIVGPADDGGFYLMGLNSEQPTLFNDVSWGEATVLQEVLNNAQHLGLDFEFLDSTYDIDDWSDVQRLAHSLPTLRDYLLRQGFETG